MTEPVHYILSESDFDLNLIPEASRLPGSKAFREHVTKYFQQQYGNLGGETTVEFINGIISVTWIPESADFAPISSILASTTKQPLCLKHCCKQTQMISTHCTTWVWFTATRDGLRKLEIYYIEPPRYLQSTPILS